MMKKLIFALGLIFAFVSLQGQGAMFLRGSQPAPTPGAGLLDSYKGSAFAMAPDVLLYSSYSAIDDIAGSQTFGQTGQWSVAILRDSDNAIRSFTPGQVADGTANTWVQAAGAANGLVRRGYDQSVTALDVSNLNHANQAVTSLMPKLFDSITGLILENGKAVIKGISDDQFLNLPISSNVIKDIFSVISFDLTDDYFATSLSDAASSYFLLGNDGNTSTQIERNVGSPTKYSDGSTYTGITRDNVYDDFQSQTLLSIMGASPTIWSQVVIGYRPPIKMANTQLMIIYSSDQSTNRTAIETAINTEYNIY